MNVDVWEPLRRLEEFDKVITGLFTPGAPENVTTRAILRPAADYVADAESYSVAVDLPGVRKEDVEISVEGDVLKIRAQRNPRVQSENEKTAVQSYVRELRSGTLQRSFRLAKDADASAVSASFVDAVLEVRIPKQKKPEPRKVEISV